MLVTCPECGARYEIDGALVPAGGRRVQCTACEHVWEQLPPGADETPVGQETDEAPRERPPLPEEVKSILRDEAEHEARIRRERGLVDLQPDASPPVGPAIRPHHVSKPHPDAAAVDATLRAASERAAEAQPQYRRSGGFVPGLAVGLILVGAAAAVYLTAPRIAEAVPGAAPALEKYVEVVDDLRATLNRQATRAGTAVSDVIPTDG